MMEAMQGNGTEFLCFKNDRENKLLQFVEKIIGMQYELDA